MNHPATGPYFPQNLYDASELDPTPPLMSAAEAQPWSNFVVFSPVALPAGTEIAESSLRQEAPPGRPGGAATGRTPWSENNPAAFRIVISGADRSLRIKQFFYDWAFPALDHPCLWESATSARSLDQHHVVWLGYDYLGNRGASARMARTMVELSVLEGEFTDQELVELYQSMQPVDADTVDHIVATSFAQLSYFDRFPEAKTLGVPLGMWKPGQNDDVQFTWQPTGQNAASQLGGLELDSVAEVSQDPLLLTEEVYTGGFRRNRELRLLRYRSDTEKLEFVASQHPGNRETVTVDGHSVQLGWIDSTVGPFDAVISGADGKPRFRLLSSAAVGHDRAWFDSAVTSLLP